MAPIQDLIDAYFLGSEDPDPPQVYSNSKVTPLVDCIAYNEKLSEALDQVGGPGDFIFIAGWFLALEGGTITFNKGSIPFCVNSESVEYSQYYLEGPGAEAFADSVPLTTLLRRKAAQGVDVRVLGWICTAVNPEIHIPPEHTNITEEALSYGSRAIIHGIGPVNDHTMRSILALRAPSTAGPPAEQAIDARALLSFIAHPLGAVHTKLVVIGNTSQVYAFAGGMDFHMSRWGRPGHRRNESYDHDPPGHSRVIDYQFWHDTAVLLEGPAAKDAYYWFVDMMKDNLIGRPKRTFLLLDDTPPFAHIVPSRTEGDISLLYNPLIDMLPSAGSHWVQSHRTVPNRTDIRDWWPWLKIFDDDNLPVFDKQGVFENARAMKKAILAATTYIYLEDQAFWSHDIMEWINSAVRASSSLRVIFVSGGCSDPTFQTSDTDPYIQDAINVLLDNLQSETARIKWFTVNDVFVHSKATLIDDNWAMVGSANKMRRSLYTDFEFSVAFVDEAGEVVKDFRKQLFSDHFQNMNDDWLPDRFEDVQTALDAWWTMAPPERLTERTLTVETGSSQWNKALYNVIDPDSRFLDELQANVKDNVRGFCSLPAEGPGGE